MLLLALPHSVFKAAVPVLIAAGRGADGRPAPDERRLDATGRRRGPTAALPLLAGVFLTGVYGGYFGAAQGVILIALLAIFIDDDLQRLNGTKNVLALIVNAVAGAALRRHHRHLVVGGRPDRRRLDHRRPGRRPRRPAAARPPCCGGSSWRSGSAVAIGLAVEWH